VSLACVSENVEVSPRNFNRKLRDLRHVVSLTSDPFSRAMNNYNIDINI
jgi:hypothetical protein